MTCTLYRLADFRPEPKQAPTIMQQPARVYDFFEEKKQVIFKRQKTPNLVLFLNKMEKKIDETLTSTACLTYAGYYRDARNELMRRGFSLKKVKELQKAYANAKCN